jgi:hypothetical protein
LREKSKNRTRDAQISIFRIHIANNSWVWIQFGTGQPFKVSIAGCRDVADLIEATGNKLGLSDRLDELYLWRNHPAGRNDQHLSLSEKSIKVDGSRLHGRFCKTALSRKSNLFYIQNGILPTGLLLHLPLCASGKSFFFIKHNFFKQTFATIAHTRRVEIDLADILRRH